MVDFMSENSNDERRAGLLLQAAVAGLLGLSLSACGADEAESSAGADAVACEQPDTTADTAAPQTDAHGSADGEDHHADDAGSDEDCGLVVTGPEVTSVEVVADMTVERFIDDCDALNGFVQFHATCAGVNSCRGLSFNRFSNELMEHTCRAVNSCGGYSCVVAPEDSGRTGAEVYAIGCTGCHGDSTFGLFVPEGSDLAAAEASFLDRPVAVQVARVAFGIQGTYDPAGFSYASMPAFHERFSRAEIERAVEHVRTMPLAASEYPVP
jgi:hypothetical protein